MPENKYTWNNIIINPHDKKAESAIGRECYFDNNPGSVLGRANYEDTVNLLPLKEIEPDSSYPFIFDGVEGPVAFSCIVVKKEVPYSDRAKRWIEENDLKVGDYVKVLRKTELYENRWGSFWVDEMGDYISKALKVLAINSLNGLICLECDDTGYDFPYFVLEKVEPPKPKYIPFESMHEFISAYYKANNEIIVSTESMLSGFGMWLKSKEVGAYKMVYEIWDDGVVIGDRKMRYDLSSEVFNDNTTWEELIKEYIFLDGTPCGKLRETE